MTIGVLLSLLRGREWLYLATPEGPQTPHSLKERETIESYTALEQISANPEDLIFLELNRDVNSMKLPLGHVEV